jgi:hypothetical protein
MIFYFYSGCVFFCFLGFWVFWVLVGGGSVKMGMPQPTVSIPGPAVGIRNQAAERVRQS